jgi:hypothetical protein
MLQKILNRFFVFQLVIQANSLKMPRNQSISAL